MSSRNLTSRNVSSRSMSAQGRIEQLVAHQVQRTRTNPDQDHRESPHLSELSEFIRRGKGEEVLRAIKDYFQSDDGVDIQTAALSTLHQCVLAGGPEVAVILSAEKWTERFFRMAKETHAVTLRDQIMLQVVSWNESYHTRGFQELVSRFTNSKVLGDSFRRLYAASRSNRNSTTSHLDPNAASSSSPRGREGDSISSPRPPLPPPPSSSSATAAASSSRTGAGANRGMSNMEAFLLEAQGDLASLEYGLEHPDMLNNDIVADCKRHKARISAALHRNPDLADGVSQPLISLLEQLGVAINLYSIIFGGEEEEEDARLGEHDTDGLSEEAIQMREAVRQSREMNSTGNGRQRSGSMFAGGGGDDLVATTSGISTAVLAGEQDAIQKLIEAERKEADDLRKQLDEVRKGKDELQGKYKEAKEKNKKLVSLVEEYGSKIDELETTSSGVAGGGVAVAVAAGGEMDARVAAAEQEAADQRRKAAEAVAAADAAKKAALNSRPKVSKKTMDNIRSQIKDCREGLRDLRERSIKDMSKEVSLNSAKIQGLMAQIVTASEKDRKGDVKALQGLQDLYKKEVKLRKQYYNTIQDIKGNIRVYCRVRPMSSKELENGHTVSVTCPASDELCIEDERGKKTYEFDSVFGADTTQVAVFEDTAPLIDSVVDGYNVCIFAYGQTGSGKTHSMMGGAEDSKGINKRALDRLFQIIEERKETETSTVSVSILEVYCEQIIDLLAPRSVASKTSYDVKMGGPFGNYVSNLKEVDVTSPDQIEDVLNGATKNRTEGVTDMNAHSSRSHMLIYVLIKTVNNHTGAQTYGKLSLVDLAGSERIAKSGVDGQKLKEAVAINKSLSALGDVIGGLSQAQKHIPFRNSILTFLLQDSMQGQAKVLMFCCVSPASYNVSESNSSLMFASRTRGVALGTVKKNPGH